MLDSILNTTSRWPLARLHGGVRFVEPLLRATYRRKVVEDNLRQAFPHDDTAKLVREFYSGFCQGWVEVVRSLGMDVAELGERVTFEGAQALDEGNALLLRPTSPRTASGLTAQRCGSATTPTATSTPST